MVMLNNWKEILQKRREKLSRQIEYRRLKRIRRKQTPAYTYCKNCGRKLKGMYCSQCGQYALDIEQPFWKYMLQYIENVYQFDTKVWNTLYLLFRKPGFLTTEKTSLASCPPRHDVFLHRQRTQSDHTCK